MRGNNQEAAPSSTIMQHFSFSLKDSIFLNFFAELNHVRSGAKTLLNYVLTLIRRPMQF
jgi:hypothetical protein